MGRKLLGDRPLTDAERQARYRAAPRFVVVVRKGLSHRAFGIYRSARSAGKDAGAWGGFVIEVERRDADAPWNAALHDVDGDAN
jgi:hypothetical protein